MKVKIFDSKNLFHYFNQDIEHDTVSILITIEFYRNKEYDNRNETN